MILFTEYADTKRYLVELLTSAVADTDDGEHRILTFHGGMGDDARDEVQRAFNAPPDKHPGWGSGFASSPAQLAPMASASAHPMAPRAVCRRAAPATEDIVIP